MIEKAREFINRHLVTTTLSTADAEGNVDVALFNSAHMVDPYTVVGAHIGLNRSYENLLRTGKAVLAVIVPDPEIPVNTDGVRVYLEFVEEQTQGPEFEQLQRWLDNAFGVGFLLKGRLVFRVTEIRPLWQW